MRITADRDIYNVKNVATKKVVKVGFDNKMDAKDERNKLSEKIWEKYNKKYKGVAEKDKPAKPFPFIVVKGKEHPKYKVDVIV
tara:strand:+ start:243 stop:491 length:249 start_codon:yes stop_codon:yes gene_type:complete